MKLILVYALASISAMADTPVFYWKTCSIIDGQLSVCGHNGTGSEAEMLKAEKAARKKHGLFFREWVEAGGAPALAWEGSKLWMRKDEEK